MEHTLVAGKQNDIDYMFGCTANDMGGIIASLAGWAQVQQDNHMRPAYFYRFERALPEDDPNDNRVLKGAFHSSELWYTFGTLGRCWRPMTEGDYELSRIMCDMWTNFAKTGNPNGSLAPLGPVHHYRAEHDDFQYCGMRRLQNDEPGSGRESP